MHSHSSTNCENLAKMGPVDVEIVGLTGIVKKETEAEHIARRPAFSNRAVVMGEGSVVRHL